MNIIRVNKDFLKFLKSKGIDLQELKTRGHVQSLGFQDIATASVNSIRKIMQGFQLSGVYTAECFDRSGRLKWSDTVFNTVVNQGLNYALDVVLPGGQSPIPYIQTWYVGLINGGTSPVPVVAAADTPSSHAGWTENQNYANSPNVRPTLIMAAAASQSKTNSASPASFAISTVSPDLQTLWGVFIASVATKGSTAGSLFSAGPFTGGNKTANGGDTVNVTYTLTAADA